MRADSTVEDILAEVMAIRSVSGEETVIADAVESFLRGLGSLEVHRDGDAVVASTRLNRPTRVILAGHLDTVPIIDNFPPRWLEPGDRLIRADVADLAPGQRVMWGRGATDMKASDAVLLHLAATLRDPRHDLTFVFYDHEEVAAELNGLGRVARNHPQWLEGDFAIIGEPTSCAIEGDATGRCGSTSYRTGWRRIRPVPGWDATRSMAWRRCWIVLPPTNRSTSRWRGSRIARA